MFLNPTQTYYRGTAQCASRAPFLLLIQPRKATIGEQCTASNTYAIVRRVALAQFGHFMMGRVNIGGKWRSVSGAYGNDGLPMNVDALPTDAVLLPRELYDAWSKGNGWNGAGNEASAMRAWAKRVFYSRG